MLTISVDSRAAERLLAGVKNGIERATRDAINDTAGHIRTLASKDIRAKFNVKARDLAKYVKIQPKATVARLEAMVTATGQPIPVALFDPRQTKAGVTVKIRPKGKRTLLRGAFLSTMGSGHFGAFRRTFASRKQGKPYGQLPERRVKSGAWEGTTYRPALPIKERKTITVPSMWQQHITSHQRQGSAYLQRRLASRVQRLVETGK